MTPRSGSFLNNGFSSADWSARVQISTPDAEILPMKVADLSLPPQSQMRFNPPNNMPVCPDNQVGPPPTNVSVPVETIVARCPDSVIGNGTATFVLNRNNLNPAAALDGYIVVFNGGEVNGQAKLKVYAFSYDTGVGIYTSAVLSPEGKLVFDIPQLTADSSVSNLNLKIPGKDESFFLDNQQITVNLPGGEAKNYVQAKCSNNSFAYSGSFELGTRDTDGTPTSPTETVQDSGSAACTGVAGKPKIGSVQVKGPAEGQAQSARHLQGPDQERRYHHRQRSPAAYLRQGRQSQRHRRQHRCRPDQDRPGQGPFQPKGQGQGQLPGDLQERRQQDGPPERAGPLAKDRQERAGYGPRDSAERGGPGPPLFVLRGRERVSTSERYYRSS